MQERRLPPRWKIGKSIEAHFYGYVKCPDCHLEDMHLKGMCISLAEMLAPGPVWNVQMALSENLKLEVQLSMCWNKFFDGRYFYGMSFVQIADHDKEELYEYLQKNCDRQFKERWWVWKD